MAYIPKSLRGVGAGSGKAPSFFMYSTEDLLSAVSAENYFKDAIGLFEPEDIIVLNYDTAGSNNVTIIVCSTYDKDRGGDHTIEFSAYGSFAGDVRATDEAGYQSDNISKIAGEADGLFAPYTYRNNTDALATIIGADYFLEAGLFLEVGDYIYVIANDDFAILRVDTTGATSVTVSSVTLP